MVGIGYYCGQCFGFEFDLRVIFYFVVELDYIMGECFDVDGFKVWWWYVCILGELGDDFFDVFYFGQYCFGGFVEVFVELW